MFYFRLYTLLGCVTSSIDDWIELEVCVEFDSDYTSNNVGSLDRYHAELLFVGDVFWSRGVNRYLRKKELPPSYLFNRLSEFGGPEKTWVGNVECPVVREQATYAEMKELLRFSCQPEYLKDFAKYFDIVSLANNHSDNQGSDGFLETRDYLDEHEMQYFGHYDNSVLSDVCEVVQIPVSPIDSEGFPYVSTNSLEKVLHSLPIAVCGYHSVYKLPTQQEIDLIQKYADHFFVISMPHQGVEYDLHSNQYQQMKFRAMIDAGADIVIGAHPHVIQEVERYNDKYIFYSLGNFIFDQVWEPIVRQGLVVEMKLDFVPNVDDDRYWDMLDCSAFQENCLFIAESFELSSKDYVAILNPMVSVNQNFHPVRANIDLESKILKRIGWNPVFNQFQSITERINDIDN